MKQTDPKDSMNSLETKTNTRFYQFKVSKYDCDLYFTTANYSKIVNLSVFQKALIKWQVQNGGAKCPGFRY